PWPYPQSARQLRLPEAAGLFQQGAFSWQRTTLPLACKNHVLAAPENIVVKTHLVICPVGWWTFVIGPVIRMAVCVLDFQRCGCRRSPPVRRAAAGIGAMPVRSRAGQHIDGCVHAV